MSDKLTKVKRMKCEACSYEFPIAVTSNEPSSCPKCGGRLIVKAIEDSRTI